MTLKPAFRMLPLAVAIGFITPNSFAAPEDAPKVKRVVEEVVVTAQRREQTLQEVPISVQVVSEDQLTQNNISSISDIANITPGLSFGSAPEGNVVSIRGITTKALGVGVESSTAIYLDGVYLGGGAGLLGDLQDVNRIEVLRGPQGTLFGRNAAAGAISVTTNAPDDAFYGSVTGGIGSNNMRYANTTINAPISDTLLTRTNITRTVDDGVFANKGGGSRFGKTDAGAVRSRLTWLATDDLTADFSLDFSETKGGRTPIVVDRVGNGISAFGVPGTDPTNLSKLSDTSFDNNLVIIGADGKRKELDPDFGGAKNGGFGAKFSYDLNADMTLSSISSYRFSDARGHTGTGGLIDAGDGTGPVSGYVSNTEVKRKEFNQELRLSASADYVDWFVGVNYAKTE